MKKLPGIFALTLLVIYFSITENYAQQKSGPVNSACDTSLFNAMHWRCIGPFRGGRSLAVCGYRDWRLEKGHGN